MVKQSVGTITQQNAVDTPNRKLDYQSMKLGDYLDQNGVTVKDFAGQLEMSPEAIRLYVAGRRVPRQEAMAKIIQATGGKVEPNDFFVADGSAA